VAVVVAAYFTLIALTPRTPRMPEVLWTQLLPLSALYLAFGIWGFDYARRGSGLLISLGYLLIEFANGMRINTLAWGGGLPADSAAARSGSRYCCRTYFNDSRCRIARSSASSSEPRMTSIFSSIVARCPGESDVCGSTC
jgi:hypothetical protein